TYNAPGSVVIEGKGSDKTVLTAPAGAAGVLTISSAGPDSDVDGVEIDIPASVAANAAGLKTPTDVHHVDVVSSTSQSGPFTGIALAAGARLFYGNVDLGVDTTSTGVQVDGSGAIVASSTIVANVGVYVGADGATVDGIHVVSENAGIRIAGP